MKKSRIILYFVLVICLALFNFYYRPIKGNSLVTDEYKESSAYVNSLYYSDEYFKKNVLDESKYYLYDKIIETSLKNELEVHIPCEGDSCAADFYTATSVLHLDHPELISYRIIGTYYYKDGEITYTNRENLSRIRTYFGTRRIEREMENIRKDTKGMNDQEKIIYVYDYVASHDYDRLFTYAGSNQSAYSFFTGGESVCAGFAKASQIIFQNIGIKSYLVHGSDHMWNYVEYEGKYYIFDATMGTAYFKDSKSFYDGLGTTTVGVVYGDHKELYPPIEEQPLKELFGL